MTTQTSPLLSVRDLRVHFFMDEGVVKAVDSVSFEILPGQVPMAAVSPVHSIGDQIIEAIMLHRKVSLHEARAIAVQLAYDVGIPAPEHRLDAYAWQLSGGLRQRAMIAMALSSEPRLL